MYLISIDFENKSSNYISFEIIIFQVREATQRQSSVHQTFFDRSETAARHVGFFTKVNLWEKHKSIMHEQSQTLDLRKLK